MTAHVKLKGTKTHQRPIVRTSPRNWAAVKEFDLSYHNIDK